MEELTLPTIGAGIAGGGLVGFIMGFTAKKIANLLKILIITLIGIQLFILAFLETTGMITVDWDSVGTAISTAASESVGVLLWAGDAASPLVDALMAFLPATGGAAVGFLIGWQRG